MTVKSDVCLHCNFANCESADESRQFQDLFDELGTELQLVKLVEKFFHLKVLETNNQKLCEDCVNHLIELVDLEEHGKRSDERHSQTVSETECEFESVNDDDQLSNEFCEQILSDGNDETESSQFESVLITTEDISFDSVTNEANSVKMLSPESNVASKNELDYHDALFEEIAENSHSNQANTDDEYEKVFNEVYVVQEDTQSSDIDFAGSDCDEVEAENGSCSADYVEAQELFNGTFYFNYIKRIMDYIKFPEIPSSLVVDRVDFNGYLDLALSTEFENLELRWTTECKLCLGKYETLQELLTHTCLTKQASEENFVCLFKGCDEVLTNIKHLARHIVIRHYRNLESLKIYGSCPECECNFSEFTQYNKHSCCRHLRRIPGVGNTCKFCNLSFQSFKRYIFHMQFHLQKHRPKICLICSATFDDLNEFFEHVTYKHEMGNLKACLKCDRCFKDEKLYKSHMKKHNSKPSYDCSQCHKKYEYRHNLLTHMATYHNYKTKYLQCEYCHKQFVSSNSYRKHQKFHLPETEVHAYVCIECGLVGSESDTLKMHTEIDSSSPCFNAEIVEQIVTVVYNCENCSLDFENVKQLKKHRLSSPTHRDDLFKCSLCDKAHDDYRRMRNHVKTHKTYEHWQENFPVCRLYVCNKQNCEESYPLWSSLYYHKKRPHRKLNADKISKLDFKCQFCKKLCPTKMSLAVHVARSHNNKYLKCSYCHYSYKDEKCLQEHIDYMHTPVTCDQCFKTIKNRKNFEIHKHVVHQHTQRYFCSVCQKGFYHRSEMENHEKTAHTQITYNCELCGFTTNYQKSMDIHMAKHNNQKEFRCELCSKQFTRKHVLKQHMRRYHENKEFFCPHCEDAFINLRLLQKHCAENHKGLENEPLKKRFKKSSDSQMPLREHRSLEADSSETLEIKELIEEIYVDDNLQVNDFDDLSYTV
uniref:C2H2-type domain-containing protein n=1 Tax=Glossina palpalis gambiensis TaxID=67801 RepID=A0A1B0BEA6_9MUSC